jgi:hypothetical protein
MLGTGAIAGDPEPADRPTDNTGAIDLFESAVESIAPDVWLSRPRRPDELPTEYSGPPNMHIRPDGRWQAAGRWSGHAHTGEQEPVALRPCGRGVRCRPRSRGE